MHYPYSYTLGACGKLRLCAVVGFEVMVVTTKGSNVTGNTVFVVDI